MGDYGDLGINQMINMRYPMHDDNVLPYPKEIILGGPNLPLRSLGINTIPPNYPSFMNNRSPKKLQLDKWQISAIKNALGITGDIVPRSGYNGGPQAPSPAPSPAPAPVPHSRQKYLVRPRCRRSYFQPRC